MRIRNLLVALFIAAAHAEAKAADIGVIASLFSKHFDTDATFNERNYGIGVHLYNDAQSAYTTAGYYRNSLDKNSLYVGGGYKLGDVISVGIEAGLVSGYTKGRVVPFVVPTVWIGPAKLLYIPKIGEVNAVHTLGLQVEIVKFN